jgi:hypothetical protein
MKLPTTIKVFDSNYNILYFDSYLEVDPANRECLEGLFDSDTSSIRVHRGKRNHEDILETIWHEVLHSIGYKMNLECLKHDDPKNDSVVDMIAVAVNTLLIDNPHIVDYKKI